MFKFNKTYIKYKKQIVGVMNTDVMNTLRRIFVNNVTDLIVLSTQVRRASGVVNVSNLFICFRSPRLLISVL